MPTLLLQAIQEMYKDDEYNLMDGDKRARVHPANGVKQDGLSLTTNDRGEMRVMLNRFRDYTVRKGLTVNASKSELKCLGMPVDKHVNLKVSEEHAVRPYMAAQQRIK
eukprot:748013-Pelagomonas_calceolata.AAC.2